jgi:hypothetical protein
MIKKIFKIIAIIFGFIIVLFIGITYFVLNELFDGLCGDYIFKEYSSPDKTKKVVIYERDCGATTTWNTNISILDYDKQFNFNMLKKRLWREENKHIRNEELRIRLIVKQKDDSNNNWKTIERVQSLLNEAQLTRIAFSIRIGALRSRVQTLYPKILVIDDMLISLDMSNRLDIAKMILNVNNKSSLNEDLLFVNIILEHDRSKYDILESYLLNFILYASRKRLRYSTKS